jgi:hypothetical protein
MNSEESRARSEGDIPDTQYGTNLPGRAKGIRAPAMIAGSRRLSPRP